MSLVKKKYFVGLIIFLLILSGTYFYHNREINILKKDFNFNSTTLESFLQQARATPHLDRATGNMLGLQLTEIFPTSPYALLGIQEEDILLFVNGVPMDTPDNTMSFFELIRFPPEKMEIQLLRGEKKYTLRINFID